MSIYVSYFLQVTECTSVQDVLMRVYGKQIVFLWKEMTFLPKGGVAVSAFNQILV
jgi:hypothetical protein